MPEGQRPNGVHKIVIGNSRPAYVTALAELLSSDGFQIVAAQNGQEALEKVAREQPSLVLLDTVLPGIDGYAVCERIKSTVGQFLPVVLVANLRDDQSRLRGAQAGADEFVYWPPDATQLRTRVRALVRSKQQYDEMATSNARLQKTLEERGGQLEQTTAELQRMLQEKAAFIPDLVPAWQARSNQPSPSAVAPQGAAVAQRQALREFKQILLNRLRDTLEGRLDLTRTPEIVAMLSQRLAAVAESSGLHLPDSMRQRLYREIIDEIVGYGPLEPLLADSTISEIMVNGPALVFVERDGRIVETDVEFDDHDHVARVIDRIIRPLGRRVDRKSPMVDARLPDGSRVNAIIPPCAIDGPSMTIRKFRKDKLAMEDLIMYGSLTPQAAQFLKACVAGRLNVVVAGGTGSGKTTLLNVLSSFIPPDERIVTIEDSAELQLRQKNIVRLEIKPADLDGTGEVSIRSLVRNALRMRPERIVVGEVRGGEALDMLQAMNTGHDGSLTTVHSNSPRDTLSRLETLVLMAGMELPLKVVRSQISSAINLIVQQARFPDGSRKVVSITEVQGMEGEVIVLSDIYLHKEKGTGDNRLPGTLEPTGLRPKFSSRLEAAGFSLPPELFSNTVIQPNNAWGTRRR